MSSLQIGLTMAPFGLGLALLSPRSSRLMERRGQRAMLVFSLAFILSLFFLYLAVPGLLIHQPGKQDLAHLYDVMYTRGGVGGGRRTRSGDRGANKAGDGGSIEESLSRSCCRESPGTATRLSRRRWADRPLPAPHASPTRGVALALSPRSPVQFWAMPCSENGLRCLRAASTARLIEELASPHLHQCELTHDAVKGIEELRHLGGHADVGILGFEEIEYRDLYFPQNTIGVLDRIEASNIRIGDLPGIYYHFNLPASFHSRHATEGRAAMEKCASGKRAATRKTPAPWPQVALPEPGDARHTSTNLAVAYTPFCGSGHGFIDGHFRTFRHLL